MKDIFDKGNQADPFKCPNCGADVIWHHDTERTRAVCKKKCEGWKVIKEIDRTQRHIKDKPKP
ncbi:MAG: hypothetical protein KAR06_11125 [Deltaproteobacteria bacterium]|nr:hypothetical protein [Deltaproteobacteria bacterium]